MQEVKKNVKKVSEEDKMLNPSRSQVRRVLDRKGDLGHIGEVAVHMSASSLLLCCGSVNTES